MKIDFLKNYPDMIEEITDLFYNEWSYLAPERTRDDFKNSITERQNINKIPIAIVAVEKGKLLGTACIKKYDIDTRVDLSPWLAGVYVKEEERKKGIGASLISEVENIALKIGVEKLYLYTPDAESYYKRFGWSTIEKCIYKGNEVVIMEKKIK